MEKKQKYYCHYIFKCKMEGRTCDGMSRVPSSKWYTKCETTGYINRHHISEFEYLMLKSLNKGGDIE